MVLIHISCGSSKQAKAIVDFLIDEKLMLDALVSDKMLYKQLKQGEKKSMKQVLIMGTTKALLFNEINQKLRKKYPEDMPLLFATPIVYMDEVQSEQLKNETEKV